MGSRPGLESEPEEQARSIRETFAELYERYLPRVFRYISYRVGDTYQAEDLTAMVFEKALIKFNSFRSSSDSFLHWLLAIAKNTVADHYRVASRKQTIPLDEVEDMPNGSESAEDEAVKREELQRLHGYLASLSRREQEIISLKFGAEFNNRQIARMVGLSESNVGVILYRAISKLRAKFKEW